MLIFNSHYISSYSDFVVFHPPQRKLPFHFTLTLNGINLNQEYSIKFVGVIIDSNIIFILEKSSKLKYR